MKQSQTQLRTYRYIQENWLKQTRYEIDLDLLRMGYDPLAVDLVWAKFHKDLIWKPPRWQTSRFWFTGLTLGLLGMALLTLLGWGYVEWQFTHSAWPGLLLGLNLLWLGLSWPVWVFKRNWSARSRKWLRNLTLLALLCSFLANQRNHYDSNYLHEGNNSVGRLVSLHTSQAHYFLDSYWSYSQGHGGYRYMLNLYRCNTIGFDCHVIKTQWLSFDESPGLDKCKSNEIPYFGLKQSDNSQQIEITSRCENLFSSFRD